MTKYIPLEEIEKVFKKYVSHARENEYMTISIPLFSTIGEEIVSLPTIELPEDRTVKIIDDMIEEKESPTYCLTGKYSGIPMLIEGEIRALKELKSRLSLTQK